MQDDYIPNTPRPQDIFLTPGLYAQKITWTPAWEFFNLSYTINSVWASITYFTIVSSHSQFNSLEHCIPYPKHNIQVEMILIKKL